MKKYIMIAMALAAVVLFSAFTINSKSAAEKANPVFTDLYFTYQPNDVPTVDDNYENVNNWTYYSSAPSVCATDGLATCFIKVSSAVLPATGTEKERLVQYLVDQNGQSGEYAHARAAVIALRQDTKISNIE